MGSSRLPGKVLKPLGGETVLAEVLRRCRAVPSADIVCCAVPDRPQDDPVAEEARRRGAEVTRGSEQDVLDRYYQAARTIGADVVMRVTSDCPLIDPDVCEDVLALRARDGLDYACNNMPPSFPHGLDCEAFPVSALERAWRTADRPEEREHVTPWLRNREGLKRGNVTCPEAGMAGQRWTLDYPEDYAFLTGLFDRLPEAPVIPGWQQVAALVAGNPDLSRLNQSVRQR